MMEEIKEKPKKKWKLILIIGISIILSFFLVTATLYVFSTPGDSDGSVGTNKNLTSGDKRHSYTNGSDDEVVFIDNQGSIGGRGNVTFISGYFDYLGNAFDKITLGVFSRIDVDSLNATSVNASSITNDYVYNYTGVFGDYNVGNLTAENITTNFLMTPIVKSPIELSLMSPYGLITTLSDELLDDPSFDSCAGNWDLGSDWSCSGGNLVHAAAAGGIVTETNPITPVVGGVYNVSCDVTDDSGSGVGITMGGATIKQIGVASAGFYNSIIVALTTDEFTIDNDQGGAGGGPVTISECSVKRYNDLTTGNLIIRGALEEANYINVTGVVGTPNATHWRLVAGQGADGTTTTNGGSMTIAGGDAGDFGGSAPAGTPGDLYLYAGSQGTGAADGTGGHLVVKAGDGVNNGLGGDVNITSGSNGNYPGNVYLGSGPGQGAGGATTGGIHINQDYRRLYFGSADDRFIHYNPARTIGELVGAWGVLGNFEVLGDIIGVTNVSAVNLNATNDVIAGDDVILGDDLNVGDNIYIGGSSGQIFLDSTQLRYIKSQVGILLYSSADTHPIWINGAGLHVGSDGDVPDGYLVVDKNISTESLNASTDIDAGRDIKATDDLLSGDDAYIGDNLVLNSANAVLYIDNTLSRYIREFSGFEFVTNAPTHPFYFVGGGVNIGSSQDTPEGSLYVKYSTNTTRLNVTREAVIEGNLTANQFYGEMWNDEAIADPIAYATQNVYVNITNMTIGSLNGFSRQDNATLICNIAGRYKIDWSVSFSGQSGSTHGIGVGINSAIQGNTYAQRKLGSTDVGNAGGTGIISVSSGDAITLMTDDEDAALNNIEVISGNLNLLRIGT